MNTHQDHWIQTHKGFAVDLLDPQPETICLDDIAFHLAGLNRYTGASEFQPDGLVACVKALFGVRPPRYNVADHSIRVSEYTGDLDGLMHDASEAYLGDVSSPLKACLPEYQKIEARFEAVIREKFGLRCEVCVAERVKMGDLRMLATEVMDGMGTPPKPWIPLPPAFAGKIRPRSAEQAYRDFLKRYRELNGPEGL